MRNRKLPVKNHDNLYRNTSTNSIVNTNSSEYHSYVANRNKLQSDKERIDGLENKVESIKDDINDIKNLLLKLTDK